MRTVRGEDGEDLHRRDPNCATWWWTLTLNLSTRPSVTRCARRTARSAPSTSCDDGTRNVEDSNHLLEECKEEYKEECHDGPEKCEVEFPRSVPLLLPDPEPSSKKLPTHVSFSKTLLQFIIPSHPAPSSAASATPHQCQRVLLCTYFLQWWILRSKRLSPGYPSSSGSPVHIPQQSSARRSPTTSVTPRQNATRFL